MCVGDVMKRDCGDKGWGGGGYRLCVCRFRYIYI